MPVTIEIDHAATIPEDADVVAVGVRAGRLAEDAPGVDEDLATLAHFEAKLGQTLVAATDDGLRLLVGLGDGDDPLDHRQVGTAVAKAARREASVAVDALVDLAGADRTEAAGALAEGLTLGCYRFDRYRRSATTGEGDGADEPNGDDGAGALAKATVVGTGGKKVAAAVARGAAIAAAMVLVRDLVNTPGGDLTPSELADRAIAVAEAGGLDIEVMDLAAIRSARLGGLLGVSRGSHQEPASSPSPTAPRVGPRAASPWWARASPSTPVACPSRRPRAWRP